MDAVFLGDSPVNKIYLGESLIWQEQTAGGGMFLVSGFNPDGYTGIQYSTNVGRTWDVVRNPIESTPTPFAPVTALAAGQGYLVAGGPDVYLSYGRLNEISNGFLKLHPYAQDVYGTLNKIYYWPTFSSGPWVIQDPWTLHYGFGSTSPTDGTPQYSSGLFDVEHVAFDPDSKLALVKTTYNFYIGSVLHHQSMLVIPVQFGLFAGIAIATLGGEVVPLILSADGWAGYYSADAAWWTAWGSEAAVASPANNLRNLGGKLIAVGQGTAAFVEGPPGQSNWTPLNVGTTGSVLDVAYGDGVYVFIGSNYIGVWNPLTDGNTVKTIPSDQILVDPSQITYHPPGW